MTTEQYWHGDPSYFSDYYAAYVVRERERFADLDTQSWMTGQYVMSALAVVLADAFNSKRKPSYPDEPMYATAMLDEKQKKEHEEQRQKREVERQHAKFMAWASRLKA